MSPSATLPTTNQPNVTECNFYIPDEDDTTSMAFRVAYKSVKDLKNNKELCTYVGLDLCYAQWLPNSENPSRQH
jgi:hypothetical protein